MTQLDLPQISLTRYFDLLKRRRWQVIPISLLGLVVGGIVAFFIPRYYVAESTFVYEAAIGTTDSQNPDDPLLGEVDKIRDTVPLYIDKAVKDLGWPEAAETDPYEQSQNTKRIESRLSIVDTNPGKKRGAFVRVLATFKDRDGPRSAKFLNTLLDKWREGRLAGMRADAEKAKALAAQRYTEQQTAYEQYRARKQNLEVRYRIDPTFALEVQRAKYDDRLKDQQKLADESAALEKAIVGLRQKQALLQERLALLSPRIPPEVRPDPTGATVPPEIKALRDAIDYQELALRFAAEHSPERPAIVRSIADLKEKLAKLQNGGEADPDGLVPNPAHKQMVEEIGKTEEELRKDEALLAPLQKRTEALAEENVRLAEGYREYEQVLLDIDFVKKRMDDEQGRLDKANELLGRLNNEAPIKVLVPAQTPPRPTEPSILLVALIGCFFGLGGAIGLILLLDVLQGSYKTIEDVERGLPVPVLGGVSHLETEAERRQSVSVRRRASLVVTAFVVLVTAIVLLYYWDSTRLPPLVRDLLALLLGPA